MPNIVVFLIGITCGLMSGLAVTWLDIGTAENANKVINECEKELPRNQHCELIAVIKNKSENKNETYD